MRITNQSNKLNNIIMSMTFIMVFSFGSKVYAGVPWDQIHKLHASDGSDNDYFGTSVAISGNLAVVGANNDLNDNRDGSGSAYVFDITTNHQLFKLLADDELRLDQFGSSVAVSGNVTVIGAIYGDGNVTDSGSAYVFDVTTGQQLFKLLASDGAVNDLFGISVATDGNLVVIGARGDDDNGLESGSAYVFDITTGQQIFKLLPSDGAEGDRFSISVAISGNFAVIGASGDDDNGLASGSAYVFDVTTGQQLFKLVATDGSVFDGFGSSIAISGNLAVIGARGDDDNGIESGSAYVFDVTTGQQLFKLLAADGAVFDLFGISVATDGNLAVIGANRDDDNGLESGSAYIFDVTTGQQLFKLLASDGQPDNSFGNSVDIEGNLALVGGINSTGNSLHSGSAYVFQQYPNTNILTITPDPLNAGKDGIFSIFQTLPNERTWLLYSLDGLGNAYIRKLNIVIDLSNPQLVVGPRRTDTNGDLQLNLLMPVVQKPLGVWFQVVQSNNMTNYFVTRVIP